MGLVYPSIPFPFAARAAQVWGLSTFVETGIGDGTATAWAVEQFRRVWAIELDPTYADRVRTRLAGKTNLTVLQGDSARMLEQVVPQLDGPALYWLDAHFMGDFESDAESECPLLAEISALNASPHDSVIMIDDARLLVKPPPQPYRWRLWPDLHEIVAALDAVPGGRYSIIIDDIIVSVPRTYRAELVSLLRPL